MRERVQNALRALHQDTRGAMSVEKILLLGLIALPIVVALLAFRETIMDWFKDQKQNLHP